MRNIDGLDGEKIPMSSRLRGVYMESFQSIKKPTFIEMNGLTFLYGPNSAGKSAIVDALKLMRLSVGAEKSEFNNSHLWRKHGAGVSSLGISFVGKEFEFDEGGDVDIQRWLDDDSYFQKPHVEFMRKTSAKTIQIEYSGERGNIKVAVDNRPLFEIYSMESIYYNGDSSLASTDEECDDADEFGRYLHGRLVIHKCHEENKSLLKSVWNLLTDIKQEKEVKLNLSANDVRAKYLDSTATKLIFSERSDTYEIRGIELNIYSGKHSRLNVALGMGLDLFLSGSIESADESRDSRIKSLLYDRLEEVANELNLIVAGLCFQLSDLMVYSHVSGDRRTLSLKRPVYVSNDLKFLGIEDSHDLHPSIGQYAHWCIDNPRKKRVGSGSDDFVKHCLGNLLTSLAGYRLLVSALRVFDPVGARSKYHKSDISEGQIIRMKIQNPSGEQLGLDEVGSGFSYILPVLTSLWASDTSFTEQPELHLHPAAQCEVGDVLVSAASRGGNCVIESHSEHILLRVLRRMRETHSGKNIPRDLMVDSNQVAIYYFHPDGKGSTQVIKIRVDQQGELLTEWPGGFFSERDRELFL